MIPKVDMDSKLYTLLEEAHAFVEEIKVRGKLDDSDAERADKLYVDIVSTKIGAAAQIARYKNDWIAAKAAFDLASQVAAVLDRLIQRLEAQELIKDLIKQESPTDLVTAQLPTKGHVN